MGWDHQEKLAQHSSQKDYSTGFGGKYGIQADRKDEVCTVCDSSRSDFATKYCIKILPACTFVSIIAISLYNFGPFVSFSFKDHQYI